MRFLAFGITGLALVLTIGCNQAPPADPKPPETPKESPTPPAKVEAPPKVETPPVVEAATKTDPQVTPAKVDTKDDGKKEASPAAAETPKKPEELAFDRLKEILEREPKTEEEVVQNIKGAVGVCEEILAMPNADSAIKDQAMEIQLNLLNQGLGFNIDGFEAKLRAVCEKVKAEMPPSRHLLRATVYSLRLDYFDDMGHPKEGAFDAIVKFADESPKNAIPAVQLLALLGNGADDVGNTELAIKAYKTAMDKFPDSKSMPSFAANLKRLEAIGKDFPLSGTLLDGQKIDPEKYKGKVVLVDFWATWCGPCIAELPNVKKIYEEYHDKGFEIIGVSLDEEKAELEAFVEEKKLPWAQTFPTGEEGKGWDHPLVDQYGIAGIPAMFLVDKQGKLVSTSLHGDKLAEKVKELVESKP